MNILCQIYTPKIEQYYTKHVTRLKYTMTSGIKGKIVGDCIYNLNS